MYNEMIRPRSCRAVGVNRKLVSVSLHYFAIVAYPFSFGG